MKGCFPILEDNLYIFGGILIIVSMCMYGFMGIFGFSAFPDEFGYWTPAAAINGYDWSNIISLGSFYSYGYSLVLAPILFLFKNSVITYRAAIIVNLLLQCLGLFFLYKILIKLFPDKNKKYLSMLVVISVMYPAWTFYTQTTMVEGLLNFTFILTIYFAMKFFEKPGLVYGLLFGLSLMYLYFVHMRCLGMIGAGILTLIVWAISQKGGKYAGKIWLVILFIVVLFGFSFAFKSGIISRLYSGTSADVLSWNDYSGITYRLSKLFGISGILTFLKDLCGKVLYLGLATFGLGLWGMYSCIRHFVLAIKSVRNKEGDFISFSWIFISLAVFAQFMVAMLYLMGASAHDNDRLDIFLHGRYIDFFLPILIALGLYELIECPDLKKIFIIEAIIVAILLICTFVSYQVIVTNDVTMHNAHGFTMIGMSYCLKKPLLDTAGYFVKEVIASFGLVIFAFAIAILYRTMRLEAYLVVLVVIQVILGMNTVEHYVFPNQSYIYGDIMMGEKLHQIRTEYPEKKIVHIYEEDKVPYIELVQFTDRQANIDIVNTTYEAVDINGYLSDETILIIDLSGEFVGTADSFYEKKWEIGHLNVYYNP